MQKHIVVAQIHGQDLLQAEIQRQDMQTYCRNLKGHGCFLLLQQLSLLQTMLAQPVEQWGVPQDNSHVSVLIRELHAKMLGAWQEISPTEELCHCRRVTTGLVDQAIVLGAHNIKQVQEQTSAGTACGTCHPRIEALFKKRLSQ